MSFWVSFLDERFRGSVMHWIQLIRGEGFWQIRLWVPWWTIRISGERKNATPGEIVGGWHI